MARLDQLEGLNVTERRNRYFSDELKRKLVNEIERKLLTIAEVCREYQVSRSAVTNWMYKYSVMRKKKLKLVVEPESDTRKVKELQDRIKELERLVGQKQIQVEFLEKMIELTEEDLGIEIKKKGKT